jgi:ABC-type phosphate transport system substrate-binding protein
MDWRCGSSFRVPALQAWSAEFKSHFYKNKQTKTTAGLCFATK